MPPKKQSAFMVYATEWRQDHGGNMSIEEAVAVAGEFWREMTAEQREPYVQRALNGSRLVKVKRNKLTNTGVPISVVENEAKQKEMKEKNMIKTIERTIKLAVDKSALEDEKFFFIAINYFTKLLNTDTYVPAEIGIVEFSLLNGAENKYHSFVNPGIAFYGNVYEAQRHSDTTHKIPLPPNTMGESDMKKISNEIFKFLMQKNPSGLRCTLYTHNGAIGYVTSALAYIAEEAKSEVYDLRDLKIFSSQELFYALKCAACDLTSAVKPKNRFVSDAFLERDTFEYATDIACEFHEEEDRSNYCALSQVHRWAFSFADYIGTDLNIKLIPGRHMPGTIDPTVVANEPNNNLNEACAGISTLSLNSNYGSCKDDDPTDLEIHPNKPSRASIIRKEISKLSLNSNYGSCKDPDQTDWEIHPNKPSRASIIRKVIASKSANSLQESYFNALSMSTEPESDGNPWMRHDESKMPDDRFFSLDDGDEEKSALSTSGRSMMGRGITILKDFVGKKPF